MSLGQQVKNYFTTLTIQEHPLRVQIQVIPPKNNLNIRIPKIKRRRRITLRNPKHITSDNYRKQQIYQHEDQ